MKFSNLKSSFKASCFIFIITFLFVGSNLFSTEFKHSQPSDDLIIKYSDPNLLKIKTSTFIDDFISASNNQPNTSQNLCNKLLLTGDNAGQQIIKEKIKEFVNNIPESKIQLIEIDVIKTFENYGDFFFENCFKDILNTVSKEKKTIVIIFNNIEYFAKYIEDYSGSSTKDKAIAENCIKCLQLLNDGIESIKNNPYIFVLGTCKEYVKDLDKWFADKFENNIAYIDLALSINLQRCSALYHAKPAYIKVNVLQDDLNNPEFEQNITKKDNNKFKNQLERYIKTDLEGTSGWIPYQIYEIIENMQNTDCDNGIAMTGSESKSLCNKFLLYGPQGNGKTALIKKIAHTTDSHLIEIKGTDLFNGYVNHACEKLEKSFESARNFLLDSKYKKVIIFIDEVDSFVKSSSDQSQSVYHGDVAAKLSLLLNEFKNFDRLYIFFATNNYRKMNNTFTSRTFGIHIPNPTRIIKEDTVKYYMDQYQIPLYDHDIENIVNVENSSFRDIEDIFSKSIQTIKAQQKRSDSIIRSLTLNEILESNLCVLYRELAKRKREEDKQDVTDQLQIEHLKSAKLANDPVRIQRNDDIQDANLGNSYMTRGSMIGTGTGCFIAIKKPAMLGIKIGSAGGPKGAAIGGAIGAAVGGASGLGYYYFFKSGNKPKPSEQVVTETIVKKENIQIKSSL